MSKTFKTTMIAIAVLYIVIGLILIVWPEQSRLVICYVLGAAALLYGIYRILAYFSRENLEAVMQFSVAIGVACALAGVILLFRADFVAAAFGVIIGLSLVVDSVLRLQTALDIRRLGGAHWMPVLICALAMLVLGAVLLFNPFAAVLTATIVGGVSLVIDGVLTLWSVVETNKILQAAAGQPVSRVK